jgi:hypothetical protein
MFATFENRTVAQLAAEADLIEAVALRRVADGRLTTLALWARRDDPMAYVVEADRLGPSAGQPATAATVLWFDGPMSPARRAAAQFGYQHRIGPAMASVPGWIRSLVLWRDRDAASCVTTLARDIEALEHSAAAVNATVLLPGEDPALLTGPDRVDLHHVVSNEGEPR